MTYEEIKEMNIVEPYCFETDMEERWYDVGLINGADIGYKQGIFDTINKAYEWLENLYAPDGSIIPEHIRILKDFRKAMEEEK